MDRPVIKGRHRKWALRARIGERRAQRLHGRAGETSTQVLNKRRGLSLRLQEIPGGVEDHIKILRCELHLDGAPVTGQSFEWWVVAALSLLRGEQQSVEVRFFDYRPDAAG